MSILELLVYEVHTIPGYFYVITKLASLALDLDAIMQELFEIRTVKNTVICRLRVVDDEFMLCSRSFASGSFGLEKFAGVSLLRRELSKAVPGTNHVDERGGWLSRKGNELCTVQFRAIFPRQIWEYSV